MTFNVVMDQIATIGFLILPPIGIAAIMSHFMGRRLG